MGEPGPWPGWRRSALRGAAGMAPAPKQEEPRRCPTSEVQLAVGCLLITVSSSALIVRNVTWHNFPGNNFHDVNFII